MTYLALLPAHPFYDALLLSTTLMVRKVMHFGALMTQG